MQNTIHEIRCIKCNKVLLEGSGEIRKICPKCKEVTHVVTTSKGIINLTEDSVGELLVRVETNLKDFEKGMKKVEKQLPIK